VRGKIKFFGVGVAVLALPMMALAQTPTKNPAPLTQAVPPVVAPVAAVPSLPTPVTPTAVLPKPAPPPKPAAPPKPAPAKKKSPVDALKPGQYIWEKRAYDATNLRVIAVLDIQRIYVFDGDTLVAFSTDIDR
jgi:hypothetical protein